MPRPAPPSLPYPAQTRQTRIRCTLGERRCWLVARVPRKSRQRCARCTLGGVAAPRWQARAYSTSSGWLGVAHPLSSCPPTVHAVTIRQVLEEERAAHGSGRIGQPSTSVPPTAVQGTEHGRVLLDAAPIRATLGNHQARNDAPRPPPQPSRDTRGEARLLVELRDRGIGAVDASLELRHQERAGRLMEREVVVGTPLAEDAVGDLGARDPAGARCVLPCRPPLLERRVIRVEQSVELAAAPRRSSSRSTRRASRGCGARP